MNTTTEKKDFKKKKKSKKASPKAKGDRYDIMKEREGKNDVSWYGDQRLIEAAGRINFTNPLGKPVGWSFNNTGATNTGLRTGQFGIESVPGIMSFLVEPGIGYAEYGSDISNVCVRNFYSYLRHVNSGHVNYNAPDLGIYLMAVDQIHLVLEHLIRIYGIARTFSAANRYMPTVLLNALGIDPFAAGANLYESLANFRAYLLMLMVKAGTLVVPGDFSFIHRHSDLFKYVYKDGDTGKAQLFVFRPNGYKTYQAAALPTGGYLENHNVVGLHSAWDWLGYAETMIQLVVEDEDMNIMSGDVLKAYGDNTYKMTYFDENFTVVPVYNPEILLEIHNMRFAGDEYAAGDFNIYQDPSLNIIKYTPVFRTLVPINNISPIIDMPVEVPTPEQIMIATRFTHMGTLEKDASTGWKYVPDYIGTEVVTHGEFWQFNTVSGSWQATHGDIYGGDVDTNPVYSHEGAAIVTKFDWCPQFYIVDIDPNNQNLVELITVYGDFENYTPVNEGDIRKLHEVALIGEFRVPLMGLMELK